jgi:hypothetical protein
MPRLPRAAWAAIVGGFALLLLLLLALGLWPAGDRPGLKVEGTVVRDGAALAGSQVVLVPTGTAGATVTASVDAAGRFRAEGLAAGEYAVLTVFDPRAKEAGPATGADPIAAEIEDRNRFVGGKRKAAAAALRPSPSIPARYGIPEETPLRIRVPAEAPVRLDVNTSAE